MASIPATPNLSDEQAQELLGLTQEADSVELKLTVPDAELRATVEALGLDSLDAFLRQVVFFDTLDLSLDRAGLVVRARRTQGKPNDSVVKLRPVEPADLPDDVRAIESFGVEVDAMPGGFVCSASFKHALKQDPVKEVIAGKLPIRKLFSKEQRAFFDKHAPDGIGLDDLTVLGPIHLLKLKGKPEGYDGKLVTELWFYPDGSRILELSTKCRPGEAFQVAAEARAYLAGRGVDLSGEQQTKTRTALEFFSSQPDA